MGKDEGVRESVLLRGFPVVLGVVLVSLEGLHRCVIGAYKVGLGCYC